MNTMQKKGHAQRDPFSMPHPPLYSRSLCALAPCSMLHPTGTNQAIQKWSPYRCLVSVQHKLQVQIPSFRISKLNLPSCKISKLMQHLTRIDSCCQFMLSIHCMQYSTEGLILVSSNFRCSLQFCGGPFRKKITATPHGGAHCQESPHHTGCFPVSRQAIGSNCVSSITSSCSDQEFMPGQQ